MALAQEFQFTKKFTDWPGDIVVSTEAKKRLEKAVGGDIRKIQAHEGGEAVTLVSRDRGFIAAPNFSPKVAKAIQKIQSGTSAETVAKNMFGVEKETTSKTTESTSTTEKAVSKATQKVKEVADKTDAVREKSGSMGNAVQSRAAKPTGAVPGDSGSVPWFLIAVAITAGGLIYYGLR